MSLRSDDAAATVAPAPAGERPKRGRPSWPPRRRGPGQWRRDVAFLALAGAWVGFDQATKAVVRASLERGEAWEVTSFFRVSHVTNQGAAFGMFAGSGGVVAVS